MATTIKLKNGSGAPTTGDLVTGEPALDLVNRRLYSEDAGGAIVEIGSNPSSLSIAGTAVTSTAAELNILDGVTSTAAELNILDGVTSTAAELNISTGLQVLLMRTTWPQTAPQSSPPSKVLKLMWMHR
jgi:hypothetical protein